MTNERPVSRSRDPSRPMRELLLTLPDAPLSPECVSLIFVTEYRLPIIFCSAFEITLLQLRSDKGWPLDIIPGRYHNIHIMMTI